MKKMMILIVALATTATLNAVELSGDLRYRHERKDKADAKTYTRQRIRARVQAKGQVNDKMKGVIRLATGNQAITSTNETLTGSGSNKAIDLDLAYIKYKATSFLKVKLGKMKNGYFSPGTSDILFDSDLTPEGIYFKAEKEFGMANLFFNMSSFWITQNSSASDVMLYAPQLGSKFEFGKLSFTLGYGHYNFSSIQGSNVVSTSSKNSKAGSTYKYGYVVGQIFAQADYKMGKHKLSLFTDLISNSEVNDHEKGYLIGAQFGCDKLKFSYDYRLVEKDATVAELADGDSFDGKGTGGQGHRTKVSYKVMDNTKIGASYYSHKVDKKHKDVMQLDLMVKF